MRTINLKPTQITNFNFNNKFIINEYLRNYYETITNNIVEICVYIYIYIYIYIHIYIYIYIYVCI